MLKILVKKQLAEIFRSYFYNPKTNKARPKAAVAGYIILFAVVMAGILGGMFTMLSLSLCGPLAAVGMDWLYFALMGLLAVLLGAFGSVFNTYSGLYLAKDNDLLLSMPIPVDTLMASRLLSVYLMGFMYSAVVIVPTVIVYWVVAPVTAGAVLGGVLLVLLISVFVLTLACALGWVVAKISLKLKHKSFVTVLISLVFFGGYYFFYFKAQAVIEDLLANAAVYGARIRGAAYPLYLLGRVGIGDGAAMLAVSAVILGLFAALWLLLRRSFLKIATATGYAERRRYREQAAVRRSASAALLAKELGRFASSPNYMLNCGMGTLLMPVAAVALLWKRGALLTALNGVFGGDAADMLPVLLAAVVCLLAAMNDMAAPSVSLEGKSLWLSQSLPVTPWQVLRAKLSMQLLLTLTPAAVCVLCIIAVFPMTAETAVLMAAVTLLAVVLLALLGLLLGLKLPNLTWTSEITPIKQSACVAITLFSGWGYTLLLVSGYLLAGRHIGAAGYLGCFAAATLLACAMLFLWLKKKGGAVFAAL